MNFEWNVYVEKFNERKIEPYNIFDNTSFLKDCAKAVKKAADKEEFSKLIHRELYYYYWCKCEWEVTIYGWPPREDFNARKVDVAKQVEINWERFIDYLWENRSDLTREAKKLK